MTFQKFTLNKQFLSSALSTSLFHCSLLLNVEAEPTTCRKTTKMYHVTANVPNEIVESMLAPK
jgi:hypothetical protein